MLAAESNRGSVTSHRKSPLAGHAGCPLAYHIDEQVAELVCGLRAPPGADHEEPVRAGVLVDVGVVQAYHVGRLQVPGFAVSRLHQACVGDGSGIVRDARQIRRPLAGINQLCCEPLHPPTVALRVRGQPHNGRLVVQHSVAVWPKNSVRIMGSDLPLLCAPHSYLNPIMSPWGT